MSAHHLKHPAVILAFSAADPIGPPQVAVAIRLGPYSGAARAKPRVQGGDPRPERRQAVQRVGGGARTEQPTRSEKDLEYAVVAVLLHVSAPPEINLTESQ